MEQAIIPNGWEWTTLSEIGQLFSGGTPKTSEPENFDGEIAWITPADLTGYNAKTIANGRRNITQRGLETSSAKLIPARTIVFSSRAPIGYVAIARNEMATNQGFKSIYVGDEIDEDYVYHYLKSAKQLAEKNASGTTFKEISGGRFAKLPIPVAPINEQKRIVEKIEMLFARLDKGEEAVREVQKLLTRYRQSVLKSAVTGQLTADWRVERVGKLESGSDHHSNILQSRQVQTTGRIREPVMPNTIEMPDIPEHWKWVSLESLIYDGPTNGVSPKPTTDVAGVKSFKLTATTSGRFIISEHTVKIVGIAIEPNSKFWLKTGDVLIQRGNTIEYVGTAAIFPGPDNEYIYPDLMMRLRFTDELVARWATTWINFEFSKRYFRSYATGIAGNMPKINGTTLRALAIPLPPRDEIEECMDRIEEEMAKNDPVAKFCETELKRSASLRQSILKDAFSGKLVEQDPNDEPASELLARIKAENPTTKKSSRKVSV